MSFTPADKFVLLLKSADIAIQAASKTQDKEELAGIIETSYNKMIALAESIKR